ncbi:MAG: SPOR domain-containing protein [Spirochaetaceae bacterium]|nr:SPOR domain-containing protein [Spirochaetaceae bacterium]
MEKKKILLVTVSVGMFLVVAVGTAILVFTPRQETTAQAAIAQSPVEPGTGGTALPGAGSPPAALSGSQGAASSAATSPVPAWNTQAAGAGTPLAETAAPAGESSAAPLPAPAVPPSSADSYFVVDAAPVGTGKPDGEVIVSVPRPRQAASPAAAIPASPAPAPARAVPRETPPAPRPVAAAAPPVQSAAARPAAKSALSRRNSAWWVQAGSFSSMNHADSAKDNLALRGITSIVENSDVNGKIWYRVRIGPYTSQNEADYWLALIKTMEGFEQSQIWQSPIIN